MFSRIGRLVRGFFSLFITACASIAGKICETPVPASLGSRAHTPHGCKRVSPKILAKSGRGGRCRARRLRVVHCEV